MKRISFKVKNLIVLTLILCIWPVSFFSCSRPGGLDKFSLVSKFRSVAKLATVRVRLRKILYVKRKKKLWFIKFGTAAHMAYIEPIIEAGIDLKEIGKNNIIEIDNKNKFIKIKLPPVRIFNYNYNFDEVKVDFNYSRDRPFNRLKLKDIEEHHRMADRDIRRFINYLGIRERAEENTVKFLREYLNTLGYRSEISFYAKGRSLFFYDLEKTYQDDEITEKNEWRVD